MSKLKYLFTYLFFIMFFILKLYTADCLAAPAIPTAVNIEQPNGITFEAGLHGDEWSNWTTESSTDNVIIADSDSYWKYAEVSFGKLIPSDARVGIDPAPNDAVKSEEWTGILGNFSEKSQIPKTYYSSGDAPQSTVAAQPAGAPQKILVLLVSFTDQTIQNTDNSWYNNFFGDTGKTVKTFYKENSAGSFYFAPAEENKGTQNDGIVRVSLNYAHPNTDSSTDDRNRKIVRDALIAADPYINFSSFDTNGNGSIDASELHIVTIIAGYERSCGVVIPNVWGHRWSLFGSVPAPQLDGKLVGGAGYTQQGELHAIGGTHMATIGVLCHELGHDLGLFDEYDTSSGSYVVGASSLMDSGSWGCANGNPPGSSPTNMDPWSKIYLGFANPIVMTSGQQALNTAASGQYNIVKVPTQNVNQYFLIENRNLTSFDIGLQYDGVSSGGIAIWHINEDSIASYKFADTVNNSGHYPGVWLEMSGSKMEPYYRNGGLKDLFGDTTAPNSRLYDGTITNIKIKALDAAGTPLRILIGDQSVVQFNQASYSCNEYAGLVNLTVSRSSASGTLSVDYTTSDGTATAGSDYTATSGTLVFADGEASKTISIPIINDTMYESVENFSVKLSNPSTGILGTNTNATVTILNDDPLISQVGFSSAAFSRDGEDGPLLVTLVRKGGTTGTLTVDYSTSDGTAVAGTDYVAVSGTITFAAGETSKTISIPLIRDGECEAKEIFNISLSNPSIGTLSTAVAVCTIIDEDIIFVPESYSVVEGGRVVFKAIRGTATIDEIRCFDIDITPGTATQDVDYQYAIIKMSFQPGETETTWDLFGILTYDDYIDEPDETIYATIRNVGYQGGPVHATSPYHIVATTTIIDNDVPTAFVGFEQAAYSATEGESVSLTVSRSVVTTGTVTVDYATSDGTAKAGSDYIPTSGTLTFTDGETTKTITIQTVDDGIHENNESFNIILSNPGSAYLGTNNSIQVGINDNDYLPAQIGFSYDSFSKDGEDGYLTVTVIKTDGSPDELTVDYATSDGTAAAGSDYEAVSGTITFSGSETSKTIKIPLIRDGECEAKETFNITLSNLSSGTLLTSTAVCTIIDEDIIFNPEIYSVEEGGIVHFKAIRGSATIDQVRAFEVEITPGTATQNVDYQGIRIWMSFQPGELVTTWESFGIDTCDDSEYEPDETVFATLQNISYMGGPVYATSPYHIVATITIMDNDAPTPKVGFNPAAYTIQEADGSVTLNITRSEVLTGTVTVDYITSNGTAASGSDYILSSGTLTFADGETAKTITIPILDDNAFEGSENFIVTLSNAIGGKVTTPTATVNISDNDSPPVISFSQTAYTVQENSGTVTLSVYRSGNTAGSSSVKYATLNGSALSGSDYTFSNGTLTFSDGETVKLIVVNIVDDHLSESSETFKVNIGAPTGAILGTATQATVTITDNDAGGGIPQGKIKTAKPLVVSGSLGQCKVGEAQQMIIMATFENGVTIDITSLATWESEYTSVATVNAGLIKGTAKGVTQISFTYNGQTFKFLYTVN